MKLRLWNETLQKFVINADSDTGAPAEYDYISDAIKGLNRVNQLKQLNSNNKDHVIFIVYFEPFK